MNNRNNAYKEVYVILKELDEEEYNKIPPEIIKTIQNNMNEEYEFELDDELELKDHTLLPETKAILFNIFRDYLATPEQKEKIIKMQNEERQKLNLEKQQKYNVDIFANNKPKEEPIKEEVELVEYNENIFTKILNGIKKLFKRNK